MSDYVARVSYQPDRIYTFSTRYRFDHSTFELRRFEAEARANFDRWSVAVVYGNYDAQPLLGFLQRREGVLTSGSIKLGANWVLSAAARYDIDAGKFDQTQLGLGYIDDCFILAVNYVTSYSYSGNVTADHRVIMQIGLRTLGSTGISQTTNPQ
jgi:LPS-assembly protein